MTSGFPRTNCCIPGCNRGTTTIEPMPAGHVSMDTGRGRHEFICGKHWRLVPRSWKRRRRKTHRWMKRTWPDGVAWHELAEDQRRQHETAFRLSKKIWARMKAHAASPLDGIERDVELEEIERRFGL